MVFEFKGAKESAIYNDETPTDQRKLQGSFVPHFSANLVNPMAAGAATNCMMRMVKIKPVVVTSTTMPNTPQALLRS